MTPTRFFSFIRAAVMLVALVALPVFFSGCAGYHIGAQQPGFMKGIHTLAVPSFKNDTLIPRIEVLVADTVIRQLQQDGTYRILPSDKADAILEGTISEVRRRPARSVRSDVLATREFNMVLVLHYKITKRDTNTVVREGNVDGTTSFFVSGDLNQDERQAIPLATEDAAVRLVSQLSEGW